MASLETEEAASPIARRISAVKALPKILSGLFYGRSGTGKTTLAASFPKPCLFLDIREKGTDSISNFEGIDVIQVQEWQDLEDIYWYLKETKKYKSVVLDQVSSMQDLAMEHAMAEDDKTVMSQRLWGVTGGLMKTWLVNYRDLTDEGINVAFIAHDRATKGEGSEDDDTLDPSIGPRLMPSVAGMLNGAVKIIGNTFVREVFLEGEDKAREIEYCLRLAPHPYYTTKMRNPLGTSIPEFIVNPDYNKLVQLMAEGEVKPIRRVVAPKEEATPKGADVTPPLASTELKPTRRSSTK